MLERIDAITKEDLEPIRFVLAYPTAQRYKEALYFILVIRTPQLLVTSHQLAIFEGRGS